MAVNPQRQMMYEHGRQVSSYFDSATVTKENVLSHYHQLIKHATDEINRLKSHGKADSVHGLEVLIGDLESIVHYIEHLDAKSEIGQSQLTSFLGLVTHFMQKLQQEIDLANKHQPGYYENSPVAEP